MAATPRSKKALRGTLASATRRRAENFNGLWEGRGLPLPAVFPAHGLVGDAQRPGIDARSFREQGRSAGGLRAIHLESGCLTVAACAYDPRDRATIGHDEIGHVTEADDAGVYEAPHPGHRRQRASGRDVNDHDLRTSRIDPKDTVCVGDDPSGERDVIDRL